MSAVKEMALTPAPEQSAVLSESDALMRAAMDPNVDMAKLNALIDMRERVMKIQAKEAFDRAFTKMQLELPVIIEHAKTNNGSYAPLEDIIDTVRPILGRHGFGLSHRTEWLADGKVVKIVGILSHEQGHERTSEFISPADDSGSKNKIQGLGSAVAYGRRYTTKDLLNIATRGEDDDARKAVREGREPDGYKDWLDALTAKASEGLPALEAMWATANRDAALKVFAAFLTKHTPSVWSDLKTKAQAVKR